MGQELGGGGGFPPTTAYFEGIYAQLCLILNPHHMVGGQNHLCSRNGFERPTLESPEPSSA